MRHLGRAVGFTSVLVAIFGLGACTGGTPATPAGPAATSFVAQSGLHTARMSAAVRGAVPNAKCPTSDFLCYQFSDTQGLAVYLCYTINTACDYTSSQTWSGGVCKKRATPCTEPTGPFIRSIVATFTGPFPCEPSIPVCNAGNTGTYELDTLTPGNNPPAQTPHYAYKENVTYCYVSDCQDFYFGLSVGP